MALYITLCGNIGVGKSTLANLLAQRWQWRLYDETVEDHPYLVDYYQDRSRWALASQLVFLERTFRQQLEITRGDSHAVQERSAAENFQVFVRSLYQQGILPEREFNTLHELYSLFESLMRPADLLVYLRASEDTLLSRIKLRGRDYERSIEREYLASLNRGYDAFFENYQIGAKLLIDMNQLDIAAYPADADQVLQRIAAATGDQSLLFRSL